MPEFIIGSVEQKPGCTKSRDNKSKRCTKVGPNVGKLEFWKNAVPTLIAECTAENYIETG
jgi:hypothetical protein